MSDLEVATGLRRTWIEDVAARGKAGDTYLLRGIVIYTNDDGTRLVVDDGSGAATVEVGDAVRKAVADEGGRPEYPESMNDTLTAQPVEIVAVLTEENYGVVLAAPSHFRLLKVSV